jgi:hypothetical protein
VERSDLAKRFFISLLLGGRGREQRERERERERERGRERQGLKYPSVGGTWHDLIG